MHEVCVRLSRDAFGYDFLIEPSEELPFCPTEFLGACREIAYFLSEQARRERFEKAEHSRHNRAKWVEGGHAVVVNEHSLPAGLYGR
jgi:hypothetical protein